MLPEHDVYITDWHNARDVATAHGRFGFDEYIGHLIRFLETIGPGAHLVAVCQPCVAALVAAAVMAQGDNPAAAALDDADGRADRHPRQPDQGQRTRQGQADRLVREEPDRHACRCATAAARRKVYPGFVQLAAFMSMNIERHVKAHRELYENLAQRRDGQGRADQGVLRRIFRRARSHRRILSGDRAAGVPGARAAARRADLCRTRRSSRRRSSAPCCSRWKARRTTSARSGRRWRRTICARRLRPYRKRHHMQAGVGHYGVFSGRTWQHQIYPMVKNVILQSD